MLTYKQEVDVEGGLKSDPIKLASFANHVLNLKQTFARVFVELED
jgi:hypothetical protein